MSKKVKTVLYLLPLVAVLIILNLPGVKARAEENTAVYSIFLLLNSFIIAFTLMPLVTFFGFRAALVDRPDELRKVHSHPTPLTGGIGIFLAFCATILLNFHFSVEMKAILIASTLIFVIGVADDKWKLSAKVRLGCQIAASLYLVYSGVRVTFVPDFLGGVYVETVITLIWIIGITNSMNFIDGMDGLAAGTCIIYSAFFAVVALLTDQIYMMYLAVAVAGSCLGFFPHNFRKGRAKVFLGDGGSTFLGFLLASFAVLGEWGDSFIDLTVPILIMSVLIFDMTLTTIVRIGTGEVRTFGEWLHYTGRDHFHHRLLDLGLGGKGAVLLFLLVSVSFGIEALVVLFSGVWISLLVLTHAILVFGIIGTILVFKDTTIPGVPSDN